MSCKEDLDEGLQENNKHIWKSLIFQSQTQPLSNSKGDVHHETDNKRTGKDLKKQEKTVSISRNGSREAA